MTSSDGNIFRVTGFLWRESTGRQWNSPQKGQWRGDLMFYSTCQTLEQTIETPMIWDAIVLIMSSHCNGTMTPHIAKACCRTSVYSHFCVPPIPWHGKTISFAGALKSRHLPQRRISPSFDSIQNWRNRSVDMISNYIQVFCWMWLIIHAITSTAFHSIATRTGENRTLNGLDT